MKKEDIQTKADLLSDKIDRKKKEFSIMMEDIEKLVDDIKDERDTLLNAIDELGGEDDWSFYDDVCEKTSLCWLPSSYQC